MTMPPDLPEWDEEGDDPGEDLFAEDPVELLAATWRLQVAKLRQEGYPDFQIAASLVHVGNEVLWDVYDEETFGTGGPD